MSAGSTPFGDETTGGRDFAANTRALARAAELTRASQEMRQVRLQALQMAVNILQPPCGAAGIVEAAADLESYVWNGKPEPAPKQKAA